MESINTPKSLFKKELQFLSDKKDEIYLTFEIENSSLSINAINKSKINNNFYSTSMTFEEFKKNRYFSQFDDLNEICQELNERIKPNNMKLIQNSNSLVLTVFLPSTKFTEISFNLKEKEKSDKEKINELYTIIENYHKENEILKKEIEEIKKFIFELKEKEEKEEKEKEKIKNSIINFDSLIVKDKKKISTLKNWIFPEKKLSVELLYRLSRDGENISTFHKLCDNRGPTITLFESDQNTVFGFYSPLNFDSNCKNFKKDMDTFIFNLDNLQKFEKTKKDGSIYCTGICGPYVAYLGVWPGSCKTMKQCYYNPSDTKDIFNNGNNVIKNENTNITFNLNEVEIWKINL